MKIAVCFYGQVRTAKYAIPNIRRYFGEFINDIDFFTHTWNIRMDRPLNMLRTTFNEPVRIDPVLVDEYQKLYPHKFFLVEDQIEIRKEFEKNYGPGPHIKSVSEMTYPYYSFYRAMQAKKEFEKSNNFEYDIVIKLRPDIIFPLDRTLKQDIDEFLQDPSKVYICYHDDVFHIATSKNMDIASDFYINTDVLFYSTGPSFDAFTEYMEKNNVDISKMGDSRFTVLRNELIHLDVNNQYHEICYLNSLLYSEIFYHLRCSWKWWYNVRNPNWKDDMYSAFSKILHPDDLEIMKNNHVIDV